MRGEAVRHVEHDPPTSSTRIPIRYREGREAGRRGEPAFADMLEVALAATVVR